MKSQPVPIQVSIPVGEYLKFLKAKRKAIRNLTAALETFLSVEVEREIAAMESHPPQMEAEFGQLSEQSKAEYLQSLTTITEQIESLESNLAEAQARAEDAPDGLQANLKLGIMYFEEQLRSLKERQSFFQKMLESGERA